MSGRTVSTPPAAGPQPGGPAAPASTDPVAGTILASGSLPTREQLTMAWGDKVLPSLRAGVKVYLSSGRFVAVDDSAAIYALPDQGLLSRAQPLVGEVEEALAGHFGRPVPLRLVLDDARVSPRMQAGAPPPPDDPADYDLSELEDAPATVVSPEQRLLQAFPGAEEVTS
jgi:hypothetical protein